MNKWLENKFSGTVSKLDDLYMMPEENQFIGFNYDNEYNNFYGNDDIDIKNNPSCYSSVIGNSIVNGSFQDILNDQDMDNILNCTEIYRTFDEQKKKYRINVVVIYPSINRAHCNILFKMIIKEVTYNKMTLSFPCVSFIIKNDKQKTNIKQITALIISVDNKKEFYQFCYNNSVTHSDKLDYVPSDNKINAYKSIPVNTLRILSMNIKKEICKYNKYIKQLWECVIVRYINSEYKMILNKMNDGIFESNKFYDFMKSLPTFQTMMKIKNRLDESLGFNVLESTVEHKEKLEQQSLE